MTPVISHYSDLESKRPANFPKLLTSEPSELTFIWQKLQAVGLRYFVSRLVGDTVDLQELEHSALASQADVGAVGDSRNGSGSICAWDAVQKQVVIQTPKLQVPTLYPGSAFSCFISAWAVGDQVFLRSWFSKSLGETMQRGRSMSRARLLL